MKRQTGQPEQRRRILSIGLILVVLLGAAVTGWGATEPARPHFYFVQMTDTHWGARDGLAMTRKVVDAINALPMKIEFVVHTGDVLSDNIEKSDTVNQGLAIMADLKMPVHYVAGNHDLAHNQTMATVALFQKKFGPLCSSAEYRGVLFLFVCMESLTGEFAFANYDPVRWVSEQLKTAGNRPVILCQHSPPTEDYYNGEMHKGWPEVSRSRWEALLRNSPIQAVIAGHFHRDELHWDGDVPIYVAGPVARFWDRQPSFRIYEYSGGRLGYRTQYIEVKSKSKGKVKEEAVSPAEP